MSSTWAELFERGADHEASLESVREALEREREGVEMETDEMGADERGTDDG